jgi:hypothetical protein
MGSRKRYRGDLCRKKKFDRSQSAANGVNGWLLKEMTFLFPCKILRFLGVTRNSSVGNAA